MNRSIIWFRSLIAGVAALCLVAVGIGTTAAAAPVADPVGITSVSASDATIQVTGTAAPDADVSVYALGPEQDESAWAGTTPVATVRSDSTGAFAATVSRAGDSGHLYYD